MKTKLASLALLVLAAYAAKAQPFQSQNFLNVPAVYATNTLQITNLLVVTDGTNLAGTTFTNQAGERTVVAGSTGAYQQLIKDAYLWGDRNGRWYSPAVTNALLVDNDHTEAPFNISVKMAGGSGANSAVTFVFAPIWNDSAGHDTAATFTFSFAATGATALSRSTNVPVWKWPGARGLRLLRIVNADTDATSHVILTDVSLNGYRP